MWIVGVRATFDIGEGGRLSLAEEQTPPSLVPEYFGKPGASSLRFDAELGLRKPGTDVIVNGSAYAPKGNRAPTVSVALHVAEIHKELRVHGERVFFRGLGGITTTAPRPFEQRPIRYEVAYGGTDVSSPDPRRHASDMRNPIGRGFAVASDTLVDQPAFAIEYASGDPVTRGPAGFGPLASYWSPRRELGGTYDAAWRATKSPFLPDDYDDRATLSAPVDQQTSRALSGGETIDLVNLSPTSHLRLTLPRAELSFSTAFGLRRETHEGALSTVLVEPDLGKLTLLWQTWLGVRAREIDYLDETAISCSGLRVA